MLFVSVQEELIKRLIGVEVGNTAGISNEVNVLPYSTDGGDAKHTFRIGESRTITLQNDIFLVVQNQEKHLF
jgi:hypothetical protein